MLFGLNKKIVIRKIELERKNEKEIYIPIHKENYYEVVEAANVDDLVKAGDIIIVKKEQLYQVFHDGKEYFIIHIDDVLAKYVRDEDE